VDINLLEEFGKYQKLGEPDKKEKAEIWQTAIGLQRTDNLTPSKYLIETAKENIDGKLTIHEVKERINTYYETNPNTQPQKRTEEADKTSVRIAEVLGEKTFKFSVAEYIAIHKRLFDGILVNGEEIAGKFRTVNITKKQEILNNDTVLYSSAHSLKETLEYDFEQEKNFNYNGLNAGGVIERIMKFTSGIWQIHPFREGNTRITAVFIVKYLRTFGFNINNDLFAEHSEYFRNALVRANYKNVEIGVYQSFEYLRKFFGNLLLGENNVLNSCDMQLPLAITNKPPENHQKTTRKPPENHRKIIDILTNEPNISRRNLSERLGLTENQTRNILDKLRNAGKIRRIGPDKGGRWEIIEV